ncbi:ABC transporter permease [Haloferula sp. A504]|uniref:ABC transporter permease n=1 Tax=Haloferula sp. A504 TaxID=3373601 RepID=UPI0031CC229F|nr:iron ABC transporter permease [Verrucomicrobiaceae bacterium E54]
MTTLRLIFWIVCALLLLPVAHLLAGLFTAVPDDSWQQVRDYLLAPAIRDSLILTISVCALTLLMAVPAAWFVTRFDFPGRRLFSILLVLPLAVPPYVAAYVSTEAREALIPWLVEIRNRHGVDTFLIVEQVHRFAWLAVMLAAVLYPYVFLAARSAFASHGSRLAETARTLGAGPLRSFFRVSLPLARPALAAGLFLVAMETLNDYGAVAHFGVQTLTPTLFRTWFQLGDLESARRLAAWMLLAVLLARFAEIRLRGRAGFDSRQRASDPREKPGPVVAALCLLSCSLPVAIGFLYPLLTLGQWLRVTGGPEEVGPFLRASWHSLSLGLGVTGICLLAALVLTAVQRFHRDRLHDLTARTASIAGYAAPGAVVAIALFGTAASARDVLPDFLAPVLVSGSLLWLVYGLTARYFAVAGQLTREGLDAIPAGYDHGARLLGSTPLQAFLRVHLPLLRPSLAAGAILVFIDVLKELPLSLILRPFDYDTLGTWTYGLATQGQVFACAAPALSIIAIGSVGLIVVELLIWKRR